MNRYLDYYMTEHQLDRLLNSERASRVFRELTEPIIYYESLEQLAKKLKYKNRSGLWKALKLLDDALLIQFVPEKKKIINLCARISFEDVE